MDKLSDLLKHLLIDSQLDAAALDEADEERLACNKSTLVAALKKVGIEGPDVTVDENCATLTLKDAAAWSAALRTLGTMEAVTALAGEGFVCQFAGDTGEDVVAPSDFKVNFLCLHDTELSTQDKASSAEELGKQAKSGSDVVVPSEQEARDKERRHGVKESGPSERTVAGKPKHGSIDDPTSLGRRVASFRAEKDKLDKKKKSQPAKKDESLSEADALLESPASAEFCGECGERVISDGGRLHHSDEALDRDHAPKKNTNPPGL